MMYHLQLPKYQFFPNLITPPPTKCAILRMIYMVCNFEYNPQYYDFCCDKRNIFCWFLFYFILCYCFCFYPPIYYSNFVVQYKVYLHNTYTQKKLKYWCNKKYLYFKKQASGHKCNIYQTVLETMLLLLLFYYTICVKKNHVQFVI